MLEEIRKLGKFNHYNCLEQVGQMSARNDIGIVDSSLRQRNRQDDLFTLFSRTCVLLAAGA